MLPLLLRLLPALPLLADGSAATAVHNGRERQLDVRPPRIAAEVTIDGRLDEAPWREASVLMGFSRYAPTDGVAADDSTEVLVWYSPTAIHFGIRAYAEPGTVNATLADRDKIYSDDYIGIFLATFNDGRQATVFAVNPLGVQGDGTVVERGNTSGGGFGALGTGREPTDISPDYVFDSKGRVTDYGYEIEVRIPFKSLRYQSLDTQTWGVNVLRRVQSRGYEYSWAPAARAAASYVAQFGKLGDLTSLQRGLVLDLNPVVTARSTGALTPDGAFDYTTKHPELGGNVRWGITSNWTFNGTVNPDFAEVESDAGQLVVDPRRALFFAEKRPFFLDGIEEFAVPNQLIYTRRIADPLAAVKLRGKHAGTSFAFLSAVDDRRVSFTGEDRPLYNLLRVQRDLGKSSRAGLVYTDRVDGPYANRVLGADARIVWQKIYSAQLQGAMSRTTAPEASPLVGSLSQVTLRRAGHTFGAQYLFSALQDDFRAQSGFINRPALAHARFVHSLTTYGGEGSLLRSASFDVALDGLWQYQRFVDGGDMIEKKLHFNNNFALRGGWQAGASVLVEAFGYDDDFYSDLFVERRTGTVVTYEPFTGRGRIGNLDYVLNLTTPNFKKFSGNFSYIWGRDENFYEWTPSDIAFVSGNLNWRPTEHLRLTGTYNWQWYVRPGDGSKVAETRIPRLKAEYQISRAIFVRAVGQYVADYADDLYESDRTNDPIYRETSRGLVRARGFSTVTGRSSRINEFRPELLFSYLPSPGTVLYAGYGGTLVEDDAFRFGRGRSALDRRRDAVFVKMSYLFRL
ncbi:MAG: DUF5916 domain-containing protein [Gemmatimonadaceae bacterium]